MSFPLIVAWHWGAAKYRSAAGRLATRCAELGYDAEIEAADLDRWFDQPLVRHCRRRIWAYRYIPSFILGKLIASGRDLLYLHCDLNIVTPISECWGDSDICLETAWSHDPPKPASVLAAPIFVRNNEASRRFLAVWRSLCSEIADDRSEHVHLHNTMRLFEHDPTIRIGRFAPRLASIAASDQVPVRDSKRP